MTAQAPEVVHPASTSLGPVLFVLAELADDLPESVQHPYITVLHGLDGLPPSVTLDYFHEGIVARDDLTAWQPQLEWEVGPVYPSGGRLVRTHRAELRPSGFLVGLVVVEPVPGPVPPPS